MTRELNKSAVVNRTRRTISVLVQIGIACGFVASTSADGAGNASQNAGRFAELGRDRRLAVPVQYVRVASTLDTLQRLPETVRNSLRATRTLPPKDLCRIAERLVQEPTASSIDMIAHYLSKDVHRWSDRMITLYLNADPRSTKATDKSEMKTRILHKW